METGAARGRPGPGMCKRCHGTGWIEIKTPRGSAAKRCPCRAASTHTSKTDALGLPPLLAGKSFDNLSAGSIQNDPITYRTMTRAMIRGRDFAEAFPIKKGILFYGGKVGRSSHLGVATLKRLASHGFSCLYFDYQELLTLLGYRTSRDPELAALGRRTAIKVRDIDVLMLDGLGERRVTDWGIDTTAAIIKHRYLQEKGLIATTPLMLQAARVPSAEVMGGPYIPGALHDSLADRIGWQSIERLAAMCDLVSITPSETERPGKTVSA